MSPSEFITFLGVILTFLGVLISLFVNKKQFEKQLHESEQNQKKSEQLFEKQLDENRKNQEKINKFSEQLFEKERLNEQLVYLRENFEKIEKNVVKLLSLLSQSKGVLNLNSQETYELFYGLKISPFVMDAAITNSGDFVVNFYNDVLSKKVINNFIQVRRECFQLLDNVLMIANAPNTKITKWHDGTIMDIPIDRNNIEGRVFTLFKGLLETMSFVEYELLKKVKDSH